MSVEREEIIWGYRFFLGREPESEDAIRSHLDTADIHALRTKLMSCDEYVNANAPRFVRGPEAEFDPDKQAYVFVHIPKCAGTTLHTVLMEHLAEAACPERHNGLGHWQVGALGRYRFFSGHFDISSVQMIPGRRISVFTLLRRPVDRLISLYQFLRAHKASGLSHQGESLGLTSLARRYDAVTFFKLPQLSRHPTINNAMVRQLSGSLPHKRWEAWWPEWHYRPALADLEPERALELALENLAAMAAFGLVEEMDLSVAHIFEALRLPAPKTIGRFQVTDQLPFENPAFEAVPPLETTPELLEALAPHLVLDNRLYDQARAWFFQRLPIQPRRLSDDPLGAS